MHLYKRYSKFLPCSESKLNCFIGFLLVFYVVILSIGCFCIEPRHEKNWTKKKPKHRTTLAIYWLAQVLLTNFFVFFFAFSSLIFRSSLIIVHIAYSWHTLNEWWCIYIGNICVCGRMRARALTLAARCSDVWMHECVFHQSQPLILLKLRSKLKIANVMQSIALHLQSQRNHCDFLCCIYTHLLLYGSSVSNFYLYIIRTI